VLLADGRLISDSARIVRCVDNGAPSAADVLPLPAYLALPEARRAGIGVWLGPADEPGSIAPHLGTLALVAVDFPSYRDGRGYSTAALLRSRFGFGGDLRAIGDVQVDQLFYLRRVGFSSFALRADQDPQAAAAALRTFSAVYQASIDQPLPHFRRRTALVGVAK
jgi:uncharacterized protein (DUF934 family)